MRLERPRRLAVGDVDVVTGVRLVDGALDGRTGQGLDEAQRGALDGLMAPLGTPEWLADEGQLDAVTALAGSGPAFVYRFIDALAAAIFPTLEKFRDLIETKKAPWEGLVTDFSELVDPM